MRTFRRPHRVAALRRASGASAEIAGVGNEGVIGISLFMGGDTTPSSAAVHTAGHAYRLPRRC
jgi:hypothetical protein